MGFRKCTQKARNLVPYQFITLFCFPGTWHNDPLAVAALEQGYSGWFWTGVVLIVKQQVLIERKPSKLPLASVRALFVQVAIEGVLHARLGCQVQQLRLIYSNSLLHVREKRILRQNKAAVRSGSPASYSIKLPAAAGRHTPCCSHN